MSDAYEGGNRLLDCIPLAERSVFKGALHVVPFALRDPAAVLGEAVRGVVFPIDCIFSVVAQLGSEIQTLRYKKTFFYLGLGVTLRRWRTAPGP